MTPPAPPPPSGGTPGEHAADPLSGPIGVSLILPAYNEEEAVGPLLDRIEQLRPQLAAQGVDPLEIIVVDDGSSDGTAAIVHARARVRLVRHAVNRGYGAALVTGFQAAAHALLAFFDADGSCDPADLPRLVAEQRRTGAGLVIGDRLDPASRMPPVRRIGNRIFGALLSVLSGRKVRDTASGYRVLTRAMLEQLGPLPANLSYTPAMTARALFDSDLPVARVPITYAERQGRSKLHLLRDGAAFLSAILDAALTCRPRPFFLTPALLLLATALLLGAWPLLFFIRHGQIEEWMFYRLMTVMVAFAVGLEMVILAELARTVLLVAGYLPRRRELPRRSELLRRLRSGPLRSAPLAAGGALLVLAGIAVNFGGILEYITAGRVTEHWSRVVAGATAVLTGFQLLGLAVLRRFLELLELHPPGQPRAPGHGAPS